MKALAEQIGELDGVEVYGRVVGVRGLMVEVAVPVDEGLGARQPAGRHPRTGEGGAGEAGGGGPTQRGNAASAGAATDSMRSDRWDS